MPEQFELGLSGGSDRDVCTVELLRLPSKEVIMSKMHVMIDIETLGTGPDAAVISMGAVYFNKTGLEKGFLRNIDFDDAIQHGSVDGSTIAWWMAQSDKARASVMLYQIMSRQAISELSNFLRIKPFDCIWANAPTFDLVILRSLYKNHGIGVPWSYKQVRCYRTVRNLYPKIESARTGVRHNALDDAQSQAQYLIDLAAKGASIL
jgi:hypothetical protein